jgi:phosphotransferase system enzyme I (PtsI)
MKSETESDGKDRGGEDKGRGEERSFHGLGVSPGIAIGPAHVSDHFDVAVAEYQLEPEQIADETARFAAALATSVKQLRKLKTKAQTLPEAASE